MKLPDNLRIDPLPLPESADLANEIAKKVQTALQGLIPGTAPIPENVVKALISNATNIWRIRSRITVSETSETKQEVSQDDLKKLSRYVESIVESLASIGIEIKDRTGEPFDYGLPEKVIAAEPQTGISKELVRETIRPTIYWGNQIVQQGEVVIATPIESSTKEN
ncbi:MAG: hypothetical protein M0Q93_03100 [Terrimicrobiaceae bacterium]|nr:hypothetical protein [Terrimicrobiaceae bacterium]